MKIKTIIIVLVVVVLVVLAIIFWPKSSSAPENGLYGSAETSEL